MSGVTRVYIVPVWKGGSSGYRYDIELDGKVIVAGSRAPLGDAARWCAGAGVDGVVEVWRYGGSAAAMRAPVARAARFTTHEGERAGPRFVERKPFNFMASDANGG